MTISEAQRYRQEVVNRLANPGVLFIAWQYMHVWVHVMQYSGVCCHTMHRYHCMMCVCVCVCAHTKRVRLTHFIPPLALLPPPRSVQRCLESGERLKCSSLALAHWSVQVQLHP
jgi:hypothetical protein